MKGRTISTIAGGAALMILILDSSHAAGWAAEGVELCIRTVIPALFPFFAISGYLTGNLVSFRLFSPAARWFRVGESGVPVLVCGFLGGYPVGAHCAAEQWRNGILTERQAGRMLSFCSQAGPSFLFGMVSGCFSDPKTSWMLWLVQLCSAWLVSKVFSGDTLAGHGTGHRDSVRISDAFQKALRAQAGVCGWVVLFRVILGFCERWFFWLFPEPVRVMLCGLIELTNGCCQLRNISSEPLRFVICAVMLNFGGLCVLMQTMGAVSGLGIGTYIKGKVFQTAFAALISLAVCGFLPIWSLALWIPPVIIPIKRGKRSRFPAGVGV